MFLRKLLAGFAIASLLLMLIVCVFWWRSFHHIDHFSFPGVFGGTRAEVTSNHGNLMVLSTQKTATLVHQEAKFYSHKQVAEACTLIPALWLAVYIRAKLLPYRPGRVPSPPRGRPTSSTASPKA